MMLPVISFALNKKKKYNPKLANAKTADTKIKYFNFLCDILPCPKGQGVFS